MSGEMMPEYFKSYEDLETRGDTSVVYIVFCDFVMTEKTQKRLNSSFQIFDILDKLDEIGDSDNDDYDSIKQLIKSQKPKQFTAEAMITDKLKEPTVRTVSKRCALWNPSKGLTDGQNELEILSNEQFVKNYRFSKECVEDILKMISYGMTKFTNRGKPFSPMVALLITLRFLATGSFKTKKRFVASQPTISRIIKKVTSLLSELKLRFIKIPDKMEFPKISAHFLTNGQFPEVFACIGSTHIPIKSPGKSICDGYFNDNGFYSFRVFIHELMLRDRPRQIAYRDAIKINESYFVGKSVLDVGCGTGILSVLCAKAGAKKVYAVEASNIAEIARHTVQENNYEDVIEVFHQRIEDFSLPPDVDKVDILISEWMGFYLLHEGMLDSVIFARDKFLKADGLMFPQNATINVAPCSVPSRFDWNDVDGVRMSFFGQAIRKQKSEKPEILSVDEKDLLHEGTVMAWLDLKEVLPGDLSEINFKEVIVASTAGRYQGVCIWFECEFPSDESGSSVVLSTSPFSPKTHWKQTVIVLPEHAQDDVEERDPIAFSLIMKRNHLNCRQYNIEMTLIDSNEIEHQLPCDCIMTKCILAKAHLSTIQSMDTDMKEA